MNSQYILAIVIIAIGVWFLIRGYLLKSKPRMLAGVAILFLGAAQFFDKNDVIGTTLVAIGFMLIVVSAYMMKLEHGRIIRPSQRRRR
ncbi:MAG: hypothetical protein NT018_07095 [Armatimonadetes bacterium]|nr:hypothetical protein [Armatimonadota bacterium]